MNLKMCKIPRLSRYGHRRFPDPGSHPHPMLLRLAPPSVTSFPQPHPRPPTPWLKRPRRFTPELNCGPAGACALTFFAFGGRSSWYSPSWGSALLSDGGDIIGPTWFLEGSLATRSGSLRNGYVTEPGSVFAIRSKPNAETWRAAAETGVIHKAAKRGDEVGEQISKICLPESKGLGYLRNKE